MPAAVSADDLPVAPQRATTIFVVDDDPVARALVVGIVKGPQDDVLEFADGEACLAALDARPDIVILDVEMPGIDGLAVCRALRAAGRDNVHVMFLSSHDDLETRLTAYDAGGDDYVVKPSEPGELARKVEAARRTAQAHRAAAGAARDAQRAAFVAMSTMGEMGVLMEFLRASFLCQTVDELGITLCQALRQYGLDGLVEIHHGRDSHCYSTRGECSAMEVSILRNVRTLERIFEFRSRLAINYPMTTLLILNLPCDDRDRAGRLRDHLAMLAEGAEARLVGMMAEERRTAQANGIVATVGELAGVLDEVEIHQEACRVQALAIADDQLTTLTHAFVHLGLTQAQETTLAAIAQEGIDHAAHLQDYSLSIGQRLRGVTVRLKTLLADS